MEPTKLNVDRQGIPRCPQCDQPLQLIEGEPIKIVEGKVYFENTEAHYACETCQLLYRRILSTEYYGHFFMSEPPAKAVPKKTVAIGDLKPMQLKRDLNGLCNCPRCGAVMRFIESQPVRIVDGKLNMDDVLEHYECDSCHSVYRKIVNTTYYQWNEK